MKKDFFPEKQFNAIKRELGPAAYRICEPDDSLMQIISPNLIHYPFPVCSVCLGTGGTLQTTLHYLDFVIPAGEEIIVQRTLRQCNHGGVPHLNADDSIIFPTQCGYIVKIFRKDAPDHYTRIAQLGGLEVISTAYYLPDQKFGPVSEFGKKGAKVPIEINCPDFSRAGYVKDIVNPQNVSKTPSKTPERF